MADNNKISNVLTQAQVDAEAIYAAAAAVNPSQAMAIKKNAQGNIMSPGVLTALSQLNVDTKSGVASSIANIDAMTRETRLADQKALAQDRAKKEFEDSARGQFWSLTKFGVRGAATAFGSIFSGINAGFRSGIEGLAQSARGFGVGSVAKTTGTEANVVLPEKAIPGAAQQTVAGQVVIKSISDLKKGKFPDIQMGTGFFPSEEIGVGHAAREASLAASKVAIRNSKGKVIGYRPRTILGDTYANLLTLGHPETKQGEVIAFAADVAGSFMFDSGLARAADIKALRKLAEQERNAGAIGAAAKWEQRAKTLEEAQDRALQDADAVRKQADNVKKIRIDEARQTLADSKAARIGKNEDKIKASIGVRTAQARLDEIAQYETKFTEELKSAKEARIAVEEAIKAPKVIARTESAIAKQLKNLEELRSNNDAALAAGRIPMNSADEIASLESSIKAMEEKLATAKTVVGESPISEEALIAAKDAEKLALARVKEAKAALKASQTQVAERSLNARRAEGIAARAAKDTLKAVKSERTLSEKLADATFDLKAKRAAWGQAVKQVSNLDATLEKPEFAYQRIAEFLTAGHGTKAVDSLIEITDWKTIWRKGNGRIDHKTAQALADARTQDEVVDALAPYLLKGEVVAGALKPSRLSRMSESITERTAFAMPAVKTLQGVGARVQSRMAEHEKVAALFEGFVSGLKAQKDLVAKPLKRGYQTKIKSGILVNIHDREEVLRAAENFGKAANLPKEILDNLIEKIAGAGTNAVAGKTAGVDLMKAVFAHHAEKVPAHLQDSFKKITTQFQSSAEEMSSYWASRHINGAELRYVNLKGESIVLPGPHMQSELLNSTIYFPPASELLRLTSNLSKYKVLSKGTEIGDILIGNFWKKLQLVRPAYIVRNIAEEQIRVAATGHISFFNNPAMALAMWLGRQEGPAVRRILNQFDTYRNNIFDESFSTGDDALDVLDETIGHQMKNSYVDIMGADVIGAYDDKAFKVLQFKNVGAVGYGQPRFFDGIANALRMLNSDEIARTVAGADNAFIKNALDKGQFRQDAVVDYFLNGPGRKNLDAFLESVPSNSAAFFRTPEGLKAYLYTAKDAKTGKDISMLARVSEATGGNKSLMELVAKGKTSVAGKSFVIPKASDEAINSVANSKQMRAGKKQLLEAQQQLAKDIKETFNEAGNWEGVLMNVPSRNLTFVESGMQKRNVVEWFFDKATELSKNSTYGPEFRQAYWDAINQVAKSLDAGAKAKLLDIAEGSLTPLQKAGVQVGDKHPVWNAFRAADGKGPLTLEDAHAYADTYARNKVKGLFYNAQEKRLIFHQLRLIAPFANAWENTIRRWSELAIENPMQVYKGVKSLQALQSSESGAIYQMTDSQDYYDANQGFFFTDPNSGQRQFFVPFAGTVMAKLAKTVTGANYSGAPIAFSANPMSFNFAFGAGSILPGVGPGVTLPLSALDTFNNGFIDNLPLGVQKWLFPFGRADFNSGLQSAILPGNWNKILGFGTGTEASYASNFKPVMNYLASGGNYNLDNPDDQARLVKDTDIFSRWESGMRGLVGLFSPVGLIQQGLAKDENGDVTLQTALYEDFQTMLQSNDGDYNKTWYDFLNVYGASQAFAIISASAGNGPSNWDSYEFVVANPDVASKYKDIWGYVMPGGGLSTEMYNWNLIHDTKKRLTPQQILDKVNGQRYYATRDALMTKVDSGELDKTQYSTALGFLKSAMGGGPVSEFDPNKRGRIVSQLKNLTEDERFIDIPSVVALRDYMYLRDTALQGLGKQKFTGAASEQSARDWLAAQAQWIVQSNPDFQKMFYAFFANELEGK